VLMTPRIKLPLLPDLPPGFEWLALMSVMVQIGIHPTNCTRDLIVFVNESGMSCHPNFYYHSSHMCDRWGYT